MYRIASLALAISLIASVSTATPTVQDDPGSRSTTAGAQERVKARGAGTQAERTQGRKVDAKQVDAKQVDAKKTDAGRQSESPAVGKERAGNPAQRRAGAQEKAGGDPGVETKRAGTPVEKKVEGKSAEAESPERREMIRKLTLEERKHRERLAKIEALRKIAEKKGQTERIAALDSLLEKENARHAAWIDKGRLTIGKKDFESVEAKLRKGRAMRGKSGRPSSSPPVKAKRAGQDPVEKDPGKEGGR